MGNADALGNTAFINASVKASVGDAQANGVAALANRSTAMLVGNATANGVAATISYTTRILAGPGDASALGVRAAAVFAGDLCKAIKAYALTTGKQVPVINLSYQSISRTYGNNAVSFTKPTSVAARRSRRITVI